MKKIIYAILIGLMLFAVFPISGEIASDKTLDKVLVVASTATQIP